MTTKPPFTPDLLKPSNGRTILGHPPGLFLLFLVEMWERFSYYGMRGLLVLYLITVFAVNQLDPGVYSNELTFEEPQPGQVDGKFGPTQSQLYFIAVSKADFAPPAANPPATAGTVLTVQRLKKAPDPKDTASTIWVPDDGTVRNPIVLTGTSGSKEFTNTETAFAVHNPTDKPVKLIVGIKRDNADTRTYFTVNDSPSATSTEIKPDKELKPEDKPYQVVVAANLHDTGRNWTKPDASVLYGWYTGLAYLFPILGGIIADKLIGTHRSMLIGGILISIGHVILGLSGLGGLSHSAAGMSMFIMGLAVIVLGTGHFKPTVSVMVGQLYQQGDPRRDGAFTIFYMGINLGAFLCAFICGTLGEKVGWHYGFASAAVGMLLGLGLYMIGRPAFLKGIGDAPRPNANRSAFAFLVLALALAGFFAITYHLGSMAKLGELMTALKANPTLSVVIIVALLALLFGWVGWFLSTNEPQDRGPVITIFIFMLFNAFFWIAFEQAGSSLNVFTEQNTNRVVSGFEVPATWFQSVNAGLIFLLAPFFAGLWTALAKRRLNPSQPVKIALGLIFLGIGYLFMVVAGQITVGGANKAGMFFVLATYFWHTVGELCLSPTGLSYVTKAAPAKFVSLLMGIWFISSFIANLGGGLIAAQVEAIEQGKIKLWWNFGGQADFFFLFVIFSIGPGILILIASRWLKKLQRSTAD